MVSNFCWTCTSDSKTYNPCYKWVSGPWDLLLNFGDSWLTKMCETSYGHVSFINFFLNFKSTSSANITYKDMWHSTLLRCGHHQIAITPYNTLISKWHMLSSSNEMWHPLILPLGCLCVWHIVFTIHLVALYMFRNSTKPSINTMDLKFYSPD